MGDAGLRIAAIAQWWAQASNEARFELLRKATQENAPPLEEVRYAAFLAEAEQGTVDQG